MIVWLEIDCFAAFTPSRVLRSFQITGALVLRNHFTLIEFDLAMFLSPLELFSIRHFNSDFL